MWLRNWEHNSTSGLPISGATVEARAASLVSPNTGPVVASTATDTNGMWEFTSLAESAHDIKITYTGNVWWHKGLTKHNIDYIFYTTPMPVTDNFLRNAGFEGGPAGPWTVTNVAQKVFGSWDAINGVGSSAAVSRETATKSADSAVAAKIVQTHVSGQFTLQQSFPIPSSMRGKQVSLSVQVQQSVASVVQAFIGDSVTNTFSSTSATTGSFVTMTVTRTIDAAATFVTAGIIITASATVYVDNAIWSLGAAAATYRPEYFSAYGLTNDLLATDAVDARVIAAAAVGSNELAAGAALANLGYTPVNKAGDSGIGALSASSLTATGAVAAASAAVSGAATVGTTLGVTGQSTMNNHLNMGPSAQIKFATANGAKLDLASNGQYTLEVASSRLIIQSAQHFSFHNVGATVGDYTLTIDSATHAAIFQGVVTAADFQIGGTSVKARSTHTGTQAAATISPQGSGSGLDADTVDGQHAAAFATSGHTHAGATKIAAGSYSGASGTSRQITTGFVCKLVQITGLAAGSARISYTLTSATANNNLYWAGSSAVTTGGISNTKLHASDGFVVDFSTDFSDHPSYAYTWVAFG